MKGSDQNLKRDHLEISSEEYYTDNIYLNSTCANLLLLLPHACMQFSAFACPLIIIQVSFSYLFFVKLPTTRMHPVLSPPHIPHLSNCSLEPMMPSQPVRKHFPFTHTELL